MVAFGSCRKSILASAIQIEMLFKDNGGGADAEEGVAKGVQLLIFFIVFHLFI